MPPLARFAWLVLTGNVGVILWGAYVRATGSGAGCGSHWPLCNGEVIPRAREAATLIEFSHRLTSGLALVGVLALVVWTFRVCRPPHPARPGAALSLAFILIEAAIGAGIVLFEWVADNASFARALFMAVHLVNTFVLLACLTLTAWWLSDGAAPRLRDHRREGWLAALAFLGLLLVGSSGAVAALGDTLFPSASLADALRTDLSLTSHVLIRLRVLHPVIAVGSVLLLLIVVRRFASLGDARTMALGRAITALSVLQLGLGVLNVILLAPIWLQLVHLLLADAIWIAFVVMAAAVMARAPSHVLRADAGVLRTTELVHPAAVRDTRA